MVRKWLEKVKFLCKIRCRLRCRGIEGTAQRCRRTDSAGSKPSTGCSTPVRPRLTALGDKPSTVCSTAVRPRQTALAANLAPSVLRRCAPGRQHWEQTWHRLFYAGAPSADSAGGKPGTVCSTAVRPRQTALRNKPSTVCSTAVRPRQTALAANLAPSVLRRCALSRQHWEQTWHRLFYAGAPSADSTGRQTWHRLFYAGATPADCAVVPRRRKTDGAGWQS